MTKSYNELNLEEQKKVYENYQKWFSTLSTEEQIATDDGGFSDFEEFNEVASWTNPICNAKTLEIIG